MKYIVDSDIVSYLYDPSVEEHKTIAEKFSDFRNEDIIQISLITLFELEYSIFNAKVDSKKQEIRKTIQDIENRFTIIPIRPSLASIYGEIKEILRKSTGNSNKGMKKYNIDLIVASTAISEASILIARDGVYDKIANLKSDFKFINWLA